MVYFYVPWKKLEPEQGRYTFAKWEKEAWDIPEAKGKHVVLRVYADYPRKPSGAPDWLLEKGVKQKAYKDYGGGLSPDYDHPAMVTALEGLISAMGKRYDRHPRVAFIQLGLLGFWGECPIPETSFASEKTRRRLLEATASLSNKQLMVTRTVYLADTPRWAFRRHVSRGRDNGILVLLASAAGQADRFMADPVIGAKWFPSKLENGLATDGSSPWRC